MTTEAELYNEYFDWLDATYPTIVTPCIGKISSKTILYSDMLIDLKERVVHNSVSKHLCDALFDEWLRIKGENNAR